MLRNIMLVFIMGAGLASAAAAQDVMAVAPNHYRILLENDRVRVLENTLNPGEKDSTHTHPAGWYYVTQPGKMRVIFADGKTELWQPALGEQGWIEGEGPHTSENVGEGPMRFILVEVKEPVRQASRILRPRGRGGH
jgi:hypothetical protein